MSIWAQQASVGDEAARPRRLTKLQILLVSAGTVASFHLAFSFPPLAGLAFMYLFGLCTLASRLATTRQAFYLGLLIGVATFGPQLAFFASIFGPAGMVLWLVAAVWTSLFLLLARTCHDYLKTQYAAAMVPFLWTGLEYFRSECYYLKFSWLTPGFAFSGSMSPLLAFAGVYGMGFALMAVSAGLSFASGRIRVLLVIIVVIGLTVWTNCLSNTPAQPNGKHPLLVGIQLENPSSGAITAALDAAVQKYPDADILALSEYTFWGEVPPDVRSWCKRNQRYLVAGGTDAMAGEEQFANTAYVVDKAGDIVFRQGKCVPIQFFTDGVPAARQALWESPWGKIGICICYDLSYSRVVDELVRQGAQALIVPTMDVARWGAQEHQLHARVAPLRAAEYGLPIARVCSSGISQFIDSGGRVLSSAPYPGPKAMIVGTLAVGNPGKLPLDRLLAPACMWITGMVILGLTIVAAKNRLFPPRRVQASEPAPSATSQ